MSPRVVLVIGVGFFLLGLGAIGGALALRPAPAPPAVSPPPAVPVVPPAAPVVPPAAPVVPATPPDPTPSVPTAPPTPATPAPPPAPAPSGEPMRPKLGMAVSDANILNGPVDVGPNGIGIGERAPKVSGMTAGPASSGGVHVGDRVFMVDGRSISSAAEFETALQGKTIPGQVVLRVGQTRGDAHDVTIVFK